MTSKVSALYKESSLNKNALQELLLGAGLFLRDLELACFENHEETPVPDYISNSHMAAGDLEPITKILESLSKVVHHHLK